MAAATKAAWVRQLMLMLAVGVALGFQTGCDNDDEPGVENANLYAIDREFLEQAGQSNVAEIALGQLADQKAVDPDVKVYARRMITEHQAAQTELKALGNTKKWSVADQLNDVNRAKQEQLSALSGAAFDAAYMKGQVTGHQVTSAKFQMELDNGREADLKAYAAKYKPAVDDHLEEAIALVDVKNY